VASVRASRGEGWLVAVELGAGCGLAGLAAMHLGAVVGFTDHDNGTLALIRDNLALQGFGGAASGGPGSEAFACPLAWGAAHRGSWPEELAALAGGSDLVLCSDVIYDSGVVDPLLWTVKALLATHGKCLLCGSFRLEHGTDAQVDALCAAFGLACTLIFDDLDTGGCRMHEIRFAVAE